MRLTKRGWFVLLGALFLLGLVTGSWSVCPDVTKSVQCLETVTVEDGYAFCDG